MSYFFTPQMPDDGILTGSIIDHLISTRVQPSQVINITDFKGSRWQVKLVHLDKKSRSAKVSLIEFEYIKRSIAYPRINNTLMQAQIDKAYLEKMFEILPFNLFDKIVLFNSQHSPNQAINAERLDKILIRSLEQSERIYKPEVTFSASNLGELISLNGSSAGSNFVFDTQAATQVDQIHFDNTTIWIGPEGGWSQDEINLFDDKYQRVNLGNIVYPAWLCSLAIQ